MIYGLAHEHGIRGTNGKGQAGLRREVRVLSLRDAWDLRWERRHWGRSLRLPLGAIAKVLLGRNPERASLRADELCDGERVVRRRIAALGFALRLVEKSAIDLAFSCRRRAAIKVEGGRAHTKVRV